METSFQRGKAVTSKVSTTSFENPTAKASAKVMVFQKAESSDSIEPVLQKNSVNSVSKKNSVNCVSSKNSVSNDSVNIISKKTSSVSSGGCSTNDSTNNISKKTSSVSTRGNTGKKRQSSSASSGPGTSEVSDLSPWLVTGVKISSEKTSASSERKNSAAKIRTVTSVTTDL